MKAFKWNEEKNKLLKNERGICFEDIISCILNDKLLSIVEHKNPDKYPGQKMYVIEFNRYVYLVPFVENEKEIFLKTIIPSRKATKLYLGGGKK
ncbi:MAG TPA: BrnT family toxin [Spirochaetota bacterium]|nr:BrnT family toxin [Spirochaetota bacterium]HOM11109.1 BrnT family toxin [Spirochaetota bacterium]HPP50863.1 BrnT family toxin [Spirochaetota bacterium]